jgi:hypothetical protein
VSSDNLAQVDQMSRGLQARMVLGDPKPGHKLEMAALVVR